MLTHDLAVYIVLFSIIGFMISHIILMYKVEKLEKKIKTMKQLLNTIFRHYAELSDDVVAICTMLSEVGDNDNNKP